MLDMNLDALAGRTVLVTGASGYIGSNLCARLNELGCNLVRWSRAELPPRERHRDMHGDLSDPQAWVRALQGDEGPVDAVVHLAAQTSAYEAARDPITDYALNARPVLTMLTVCREQQLRPTIILAGTSTACGMPRTRTVGPDHPDAPVTVYDIHKLIAERYLKYFCSEGVVSGGSLRLTNVYGPGPCSSSQDRGILNMMVRRGLAGEHLTVYGEGQQVRDYIYIQDVVDAFAAAVAHGASLSGEHFVVGSGTGTTIRSALELVAERLSAMTGQSPEVVRVPPPPGLSIIEERNFIADISAFSARTGWSPKVRIELGIEETIRSFLDREQGRQ
jgi:Nucleoside-diphosphate-sugar epimerases